MGLPGVILHGMCTMALCARAVVDELAGGDPNRLRRLAVRFYRPVFPGNDLVTTMYDAGTAGGRRVVAFEASSAGKVVVRDGRAEVTSLMAVLRLFASAREAAGLTTAEIPAATVAEVLDEACRRFGDRFAAVLATSKVWVNGEPADAVDAGGRRRRGGRAARRCRAGRRCPPAPPVTQCRRRPGPTPPRRSWSGATWRSSPTCLTRSGARAPRPRPSRSGRRWPSSTRASGPTAASGWPGPRSRSASPSPARPTWPGGWRVAAFIAGAQTCLVWRKRGERPVALAAAAIAAGLPVAASFDAGAMAGVVAAGVLVTFVTRLRAPTRAPSRDVALTLAVGVAIGLAAAGPVLVRHTGISAALLLLAMICAYDAGAYLVGTGASSAWEGPAAGVAALIPLTIFAEVVLVPPFAGPSRCSSACWPRCWRPCGPVAASALLGDRSGHAPALRRLDSLLLLGPLWAWCAVDLPAVSLNW